MAAVMEAVAAGHVTPGEAAEVGKVIDVYVRAYQTAVLDAGIVPVARLTDTQLHRIAAGRHLLHSTTTVDHPP